jgi:hypothetical protein
MEPIIDKMVLSERGRVRLRPEAAHTLELRRRESISSPMVADRTARDFLDGFHLSRAGEPHFASVVREGDAVSGDVSKRIHVNPLSSAHSHDWWRYALPTVEEATDQHLRDLAEVPMKDRESKKTVHVGATYNAHAYEEDAWIIDRYLRSNTFNRTRFAALESGRFADFRSYSTGRFGEKSELVLGVHRFNRHAAMLFAQSVTDVDADGSVYPAGWRFQIDGACHLFDIGSSSSSSAADLALARYLVGLTLLSDLYGKAEIGDLLYNDHGSWRPLDQVQDFDDAADIVIVSREQVLVHPFARMVERELSGDEKFKPAVTLHIARNPKQRGRLILEYRPLGADETTPFPASLLEGIVGSMEDNFGVWNDHSGEALSHPVTQDDLLGEFDTHTMIDFLFEPE